MKKYQVLWKIAMVMTPQTMVAWMFEVEILERWNRNDGRRLIEVVIGVPESGPDQNA